MGEKEPDDNIIVLCGKCTADFYPAKGKYTRRMLRFAKFVKACFGTGPKEHMWVQVQQLQENYVVGILSNIPVVIDHPNYGELVRVPYSEIEDAL